MAVQRTKRTLSAREKLLKRLSEGWSISAACKSAGIARTVYYDMIRDEPEFAAAADEALEGGTDRLEDSATQQALRGNAALMALLLKARRPEKYRDTFKLQHSGPNGEPLTITHIAVVPPSALPEAIDAGDD